MIRSKCQRGKDGPGGGGKNFQEGTSTPPLSLFSVPNGTILLQFVNITKLSNVLVLH